MIHSFIFIIKKIKKELTSLLLLVFFIPILSVVISPLAIKILIDKGLTDKNLYIVFACIFALVVGRVLSVVLGYFLKLKIKQASLSFIEKFVELGLNGYYKYSYQEIYSKSEGYYLSRIYDEPKELSNEFIPILIYALKDLLTLSFGLAVALYIAWEVTLVLLALVPILYWLARKYNNRIKNVVNIEAENEADLRGIVSTSIKAFKTTLLYNLKGVVTKILNENLETFTDSAYKTEKTISYFSMISSICFAVSQVLVILLASIAILAGKLSIGGMMGYLNAYGRILVSINSFADSIPKFYKYQKYIDRLKEIADKNKDEKDTESFSSKNILLKNASFSYNSTDVIKKFSIYINENSNVLIKGGNGTGKTTLANIIAGFMPVDKVEKIQIPDPRYISGIIEPYHFIPGTVEQNLNLSKSPQRKRKLELLEKYQLKNKLHKKVKTLSYGQQKKIYLILAMTKESNLYIYDEPLKGIDKKSRAPILHDLVSHAKDATLIIISHQEVKKGYFNQTITL